VSGARVHLSLTPQDDRGEQGETTDVWLHVGSCCWIDNGPDDQGVHIEVLDVLTVENGEAVSHVEPELGELDAEQEAAWRAFAADAEPVRTEATERLRGRDHDS
jgi:hypothetical protein